MSEKRILQVNLEDRGGAFSLVYQIQKVLQDKIIFDYYSMGNFKNKEIIDSIYDMKGMIIEANLRKNRFAGHLLLPIHFYFFLKESDYEIIHIHSDTAWKLLIYALPAKIARINRIIVHSHSSDINGDHRIVKLLCHKMARCFLPKFAHIYCTCSSKAAVWMYPPKIQKRVLFIKNGIDVEKYAFNIGIREKLRNELNVQDNVFLIGTVGDFSYPKNPEYLIKILCELVKKDNRIKLLFIGDGDGKNTIKSMIKGKVYEYNIIFYGYSNSVNEVLNVLDCFALPSRFEGFPVSAVEAQANGLPCILSDTISEQCRLTDMCSFLSLDEKVDKWVNMILFYREKKIDRYAGKEKVIEQGFNIESCAHTMYRIYYR